jgi:hypothetical protein
MQGASGTALAELAGANLLPDRVRRGCCASVHPLASLAALAQNAPTYKVDPFWPKQLPNDWIIGQIRGLTVDHQNHIWVLQCPDSDTPDELGAA